MSETVPLEAAPSTPRPTAADRLTNLGWGALGAAPLAAAAIVLTPSPSGMGTHRQLGLPPCTFLFLTGFPCPFCGMTTAWTHAAHGDPLSAFTTQPMGLVLFVADLALVLWLFARAAAGREGFRPDKLISSLPFAVLWLSLAGLGASWIYKILVVRGWI